MDSKFLRLTEHGKRPSRLCNDVCCTHFNSTDCQSVLGHCSDGCVWNEEAWAHLAAYEDSGCSPEEVMRLVNDRNDARSHDMPVASESTKELVKDMTSTERLGFIHDILLDYDGWRDVKNLFELIDEAYSVTCAKPSLKQREMDKLWEEHGKKG